ERVPEHKAAALSALLSDFRIERRLTKADGGDFGAIAGWFGSRRQGYAKKHAAALGLPLLLFGEGLLCAPPGWGRPTPVLSATALMMTGPESTADLLDAGRLLATRGWETGGLLARAAAARCDMATRRLGGAWWTSGIGSELLPSDGFALIIADEGPIGSPSPALLRAMLDAALAENEPRRVVLLAGASDRQRHQLRRCLREAAKRGCTVLAEPVSRWEAIERAGCVYTAGGKTGFLALMAGAKTRCFADSFYSGWGLTTDEPGLRPKPFRRTIDEVFAGACLLATRCLDPYHIKPASFEDSLDLIAEWQKIEAANRGIAVAIGMSFWKRRQVAYFLRSSVGTPSFRRSVKTAVRTARSRRKGAIAVWASRSPPGLADAAQRNGIALIRIEDGFIRSVGLGSDFTPAASLVLDHHGMHFDPSVRSDLERLLFEAEFDGALIERARALIARLVIGGVTKYNLGKGALTIGWPAGRRRILVPGQVEDDLSVRLGGEGISGNLDLLAQVRSVNPDAFIIYKPHPDVEAGHRNGKIRDDIAGRFADLVIRDVSTAALLGEIDELHTLTSLSGFEALLRGRQVVVYGHPFYAGWGLTCDIRKIDRGRHLTLEQLVAGALILYPRYLDPVTRLPCGPELIIERLGDPELWRPGLLVTARRLQGLAARRWGEFTGHSARRLARPLQPPGRNDFRTPQL
ncbi:MAG: hypothetical protein WA633_13880, partial [Stellaceae bacterium]